MTPLNTSSFSDANSDVYCPKTDNAMDSLGRELSKARVELSRYVKRTILSSENLLGIAAIALEIDKATMHHKKYLIYHNRFSGSLPDGTRHDRRNRFESLSSDVPAIVSLFKQHHQPS